MHSTRFYDSVTAIDTVELEDEDKVFFPDSDEDERTAGDNEVLQIDGCGATPTRSTSTIIIR